jgi:hypothetical protein
VGRGLQDSYDILKRVMRPGHVPGITGSLDETSQQISAKRKLQLIILQQKPTQAGVERFVWRSPIA